LESFPSKVLTGAAKFAAEWRQGTCFAINGLTSYFFAEGLILARKHIAGTGPMGQSQA
jgi:hypothetical protein